MTEAGLWAILKWQLGVALSIIYLLWVRFLRFGKYSKKLAESPEGSEPKTNKKRTKNEQQANLRRTESALLPGGIKR